MRKVLAVVLLLVMLPWNLKTESDKVVVVSNSIDYSPRLIGYLQESFEVTSISAQEFPLYQSQYQYKYFVILGGPDAPQGIGEIVRSILSSNEQEYVRTGARNFFIKTKNGKTYFILAGSDREQTSFAVTTLEKEILNYISIQSIRFLEGQDIKDVTCMAIADLDNDSVYEYIFGCYRIVSDPWDRGMIYICDKEGNLRWKYNLPAIIYAIITHDLDSDDNKGTKEIIVACKKLADGKGYIYVFNDLGKEGRVRWNKTVQGKPKSLYCFDRCVATFTYEEDEQNVVIFDHDGNKEKEIPVEGDISKFEIRDMDSDGEYELIISDVVDNNWGHFLSICNLEGEVSWEYEPNEYIRDFQLHDIDNDGTVEIIIGVQSYLEVIKEREQLWRLDIPSPIRHVRIVDHKILVSNSNTLFLIDHTRNELSEYSLDINPEFLFVMNIDKDDFEEIIVADGRTYRTFHSLDFGSPEIGGSGPTYPSVLTFEIYENSDYGVKFGYPKNWTLEEKKGPELLVTIIAPLGEHFTISTEDLSGNPMFLEEYTQLTIEKLEQVKTDFNVIESESGETTFAYYYGYKIVFTEKEGERTIKNMNIWTIKNDKLYIFSFSAEESEYSRSKEIVKEMIDSFRTFKKVPISICDANLDALGEDDENLNGEWVKVCNDGDTNIEMKGWKLLKDQNDYYEFPDGFILEAGSSVIVYTGSGMDTKTEKYWERSEEAWNNDGDVVILADSEGNIVAEYEWIPQ